MSIITPETKENKVILYCPNTVDIKGFAEQLVRDYDLNCSLEINENLEHVRYMNKRLNDIEILISGDSKEFQELFLRFYDDFIEANGF